MPRLTLTPTYHYDQTGGFEITPPRQALSPLQHQGQVLEVVIETGYEARAWPLIDAHLAALPWLADIPVKLATAQGKDKLPLLFAKFASLHVPVYL